MISISTKKEAVRWLRFVLFPVALAAAVGCGSPDCAQDMVSPTETPQVDVATHHALHRGIDVSNHSGVVAWQAVSEAGHTFAFIKASEGVDLKDPAFDANWKAAAAAGLVRGAYHFYVSEDDPQAQAQFFIDTVRLEPGDLAPVVDIELIGRNTPPGLADRLRLFVRILEDHFGVRPIIYTSPKFWNTHLDGSFGHHPLWIAEYGVDEPTLPVGWDRWDLWQWQGDATVHGVEKGADLSKVNPSLTDLQHLVVSPKDCIEATAPNW